MRPAAGSTIELPLAQARALGGRVLEKLGYPAASRETILDHLIDCELRGLGFSGLARLISVAERLGRAGPPLGEIGTERETPVSALVTGGDQIGYLVAHRATRIAIDKALASGIAVVGARDTWYTGMLSFYAEMAAQQGLVTLITSHTAPWVAPAGGTQARYGTNPICIGVPCGDNPVIWDIGTSALIHAQATLAARLGQELPEGCAFDAQGQPTRNPVAALAGAFAPWGGHRGSGLGMMIQILGGLTGAAFAPEGLAGFGFLVIAMRADLFGDAAAFEAGLSAYADLVRETPRLEPDLPVRLPFDRSRELRARRLFVGTIPVEKVVIDQLGALALAPSPACREDQR